MEPCGPRREKTPPATKEIGRFTREIETGECSVECSGKNCGSCSAGMVADCVALCCCPLAVVSLLGLAFIKVPCAMGKRCLGRRKRKEREKRMLCVSRKDGCIGVTSGKGEEFGVKEGKMVEDSSSLCAEVIEADNLLLEMCQVGHLGFGAISCNETQPNDKCN